jgi:hypothetical protein
LAGVRNRRAERVKRQPERSCIACRETRGKRELIRIVRDPSGGVSVDAIGKLPGRGAYLCAVWTCWDKGAAKGTIEHHLHLEHPLSNEQLALLQKDGLAIIESFESSNAGERVCA